MARISEAIGYDVEVSEPNGPTVHGYITSRWADSRQPEFDRWLAEHDREVAARAWDEGFEEPRECCGLCPLRSCPWDNGGDGPTNPYHEED